MRRIENWFRTQLPSLERNGPACALIAVALLQAKLVYTEDLTQWKGGGFGMFSTVDSGGGRIVSVTLRRGESSHSIPPEANGRFKDLYSLTKRLPSENNLTSYARALASRGWARLDPLVHDDACGHDHGADQCLLARISGMAQEYVASLAEEPTESPLRTFSLGALYPGLGALEWSEWEPQRPRRGKLQLIDEVEVTVSRLEYSIDDGVLRAVPIRTVTYPGFDVDGIADRYGVSADTVRKVWLR